MTDIPVLELSGEPFDMGLAHGRALADAIAGFAESVTRVHQDNNSHARVDAASLKAFCRRNLGFLEAFSPELLEEMRGIAEGSHLPFEDILYLNCFLELEDLRAPCLSGRLMPPALWGCTTFNVAPQGSADGRAYIGQTFDMEKYYEKYLALLRIRPETGPDMLVVTMAGVLGCMGLNDAGVGAVINKVTTPDARPGVIYPFVMRKALGASRIGDALGAVIFASRATGMNYQLAGEGTAFCAETSAACYELLPFDEAIAHTNHFTAPSMRRFETPHWLSHGGSMVRRQVADRFLADHAGRLTPDLLKALCRDHTNHPRSICAHGFPEQGENTAFHTIFAAVMDPAAGWMDLCAGSPCENAFTRHHLAGASAAEPLAQAG